MNLQSMRTGYMPSVLIVCAVLSCLYTADVQSSWRTASRMSAGIAPDPVATPEAVVQVYGARAFSWRGYFGIHTWIAVKPSHAKTYTIYEVLGWRRRSRLPVLAIYDQIPDRYWYGNEPVVLADKRGKGVDALIERIDQAAQEYPYARKYALWPGPNSNTFTAWVSRTIPELELNLPATAIGKDFSGYRLIGKPPSGNGLQISIFGLLGIVVSRVEGFEFNLLGLTFGISANPWMVKLPVIGNIVLSG